MTMKRLSDYPAYENCYHFVGVTKYRINLFDDEQMRCRLKEIIEEIAEAKEHLELIECTVAYNHVHMLLRSILTPAQAGQALFGVSSRKLRLEYPKLRERVESGLWGGKSWEAIKDRKHLENCILYIQRHQPDNTKVY